MSHSTTHDSDEWLSLIGATVTMIGGVELWFFWTDVPVSSVHFSRLLVYASIVIIWVATLARWRHTFPFADELLSAMCSTATLLFVASATIIFVAALLCCFPQRSATSASPESASGDHISFWIFWAFIGYLGFFCGEGNSGSLD